MAIATAGACEQNAIGRDGRTVVVDGCHVHEGSSGSSKERCATAGDEWSHCRHDLSFPLPRGFSWENTHDVSVCPDGSNLSEISLAVWLNEFLVSPRLRFLALLTKVYRVRVLLLSFGERVEAFQFIGKYHAMASHLSSQV